MTEKQYVVSDNTGSWDEFETLQAAKDEVQKRLRTDRDAAPCGIWKLILVGEPSREVVWTDVPVTTPKKRTRK